MGQIDHDRPRIPLIHLAQQRQQEFDDASTIGSPQPVRKSLSTITERTERTEPSTHAPSKQPFALNPSRAPSSSVCTSYGQIIGKRCGRIW